MLLKSILRSVAFRAALLIIAFFLLALLFVSPPIRYSNTTTDRTFPDSIDKDEPSTQFIAAEYQKAIDEIKFRLEQQDSWYHYKFIFIGGLLALFLGQTGLLSGLFKGRPSASANADYSRIKNILTADSNYAVMVLACVLALIVDMHLRNHMFSMQTLGLWIANYVEPSYFPKHPGNGFYPWEQFIRNPHSSSLHLDSLYRLAFSTHLHFMTTIIYLLYLTVFQQICLTFNKIGGRMRKQIILLGFVFVHLSVLAFIFVAHAVPSTYEMLLIPFNRWANGWISLSYYIIPWLVLVALNLPYLLFIRIRKTARRNKASAITIAV